MTLAPIILFTYNRPWHTKQVLDALSLNAEAQNSNLYVYCDGPKENEIEDVLQKIKETHSLLSNENRFKEIKITTLLSNKGLANSIIDGVTEVINIHGSAIILEDDVVPSIGFLKYMNEALNFYSKEEKVGCIHAWNYSLDTTNYPSETFFLKGADCWGWATWKRAWNEFNSNGAELLKKISATNSEFEFNRRGSQEFTKMLEDQVAGKNNSWAIRWHASLFLKNKYCLQPTKPIVKNIGLDNSGFHCGTTDLKQMPIDFISIKPIEIKEPDWFFQSYSQSLKQSAKPPTNQWQKVKTSLKHLFRQ